MSDTLQFPTPTKVDEGTQDQAASGRRTSRDRAVSRTRKQSRKTSTGTKQVFDDTEVSAALESLKNAVAPEVDPDFEGLRNDFQKSLAALLDKPEQIPEGKKGDDQGPLRETIIFRFVRLLGPLSASKNSNLYRMAQLGINSLNTGRLTAARSIVDAIEFATSTSAALTQVMRGLTRFVLIFGAVFFLVAYPLAVLSFTGLAPTKLQAILAFLDDYKPIFLAIAFGMVGSVVSLLLRLEEFEVMKGRSPEFLRLYGATLPLIGAAFAAVIATLFASKVLNLGVQQQAADSPLNIHLFMVIGFLSGFSERFSRGLLSSAENAFASRAQEQESKSASVKLSKILRNQIPKRG